MTRIHEPNSADVATYAANLRIVFEKAANGPWYHSGITWYPRAIEWLEGIAHRQDLPPDIVAGVVAALSPQVRWDSQLMRTEPWIDSEQWKRGLGRYPGFPANWEKARDIMANPDGEPLSILRGPKVRAFFRNLTGDTEAVTIDRHAISAALGEPIRVWPGAVTLRGIVKAYTIVAEKAGVEPCEAQAIIWEWWRDNGAS